jgi:hypothetical protein
MTDARRYICGEEWGSDRDRAYIPNHRYDDVFIRMTSDERIEWNAEDITPSTSVCLYKRGEDFDTRELLTRICNPDSKIDVLLENSKSVTLCVSYWVLVDLRDATLDAEQRPCGLEDPHMPECHPDTGLGRHLVPACRSILQKFTNLHVYFDETHLDYWENCCFARYAGVVRTFKNISDYDYASRDKYGPFMISMLEKAYTLYGTITERVVLLHGIDDSCDDGCSSELHRYIQIAQDGMYEGDWRHMDPFKKPYITYMRFRNLPLSAVPMAAEYPNLRHLEADVTVDTPSISIPDCPELQRLEIIGYGIGNGICYSNSPEFSVIIHGCKKLRCIRIWSDTAVHVTWEKE